MKYLITVNKDNSITVDFFNISIILDYVSEDTDFFTIEATDGQSFGRLGFGEMSVFLNPKHTDFSMTSPVYEAEEDRILLIERIEQNLNLYRKNILKLQDAVASILDETEVTDGD